MSRLTNVIPCKVLLILYQTLVFPYLNYYNVIWGCAGASTMSKLITLQKRAVRVIVGAQYRATTSPLFGKLQMNDLNVLQTVTYMFNIKYNLLPQSCTHLVLITNKDHHYDTRTYSYFAKDSFRINAREHSISIHGPRAWDSLPSEIQDCTSLAVFKKKVSLHLINAY